MFAFMFPLLIVLGCALSALSLAWFYFGRYTIKRAPIGVFNLADVLFMMAAIVLVPLLYMLLPRWAVAALMVLETCGLIYIVWEPVLARRLSVLLATGGLLGAYMCAVTLAGTGSKVFFAANDLILLLVVVGIANLLAQSGLKARDAALLGAFLVGYDFIATSRLPLMVDLVHRLSGLPFSPMFAWPVTVIRTGADSVNEWVGFGLGDLIIATVFPLVMRKAFGKTAGLVALTLSFATFVFLFVLPLAGLFPVMVVLGPLMIGQYLFWRRRKGAERTTRQYLRDTARPHPYVVNAPQVPEVLHSALLPVEER